jgi:hypothetical protein
MPSTSKKQHNFMAAIAHSPSFAKKAGVPQSVGRDFNEADKGRKFSTGGNMKKMAGGGSTIGKTGTSEKKGLTNEKMASVKTAAPSRDGVAAKGKTKGMMPKMKGNTVGNGPLVNVKGPAMKRGGKTK